MSAALHLDHWEAAPARGGEPSETRNFALRSWTEAGLAGNSEHRSLGLPGARNPAAAGSRRRRSSTAGRGTARDHGRPADGDGARAQPDAPCAARRHQSARLAGDQSARRACGRGRPDPAARGHDRGPCRLLLRRHEPGRERHHPRPRRPGAGREHHVGRGAGHRQRLAGGRRLGPWRPRRDRGRRQRALRHLDEGRRHRGAAARSAT